MISYRISPPESDTVVEVETSDDPERGGVGAYITVTDDENPAMSVLLGLEEVRELRKVLEDIGKSLGETG
jgi:hypothetical protein